MVGITRWIRWLVDKMLNKHKQTMMIMGIDGFSSLMLLLLNNGHSSLMLIMIHSCQELLMENAG